MKAYPDAQLVSCHSPEEMLAADRGTLEKLKTLTASGERRIIANFLRPGQVASHTDDRLRVTGSKGTLEIRGQELILINENGGHHFQGSLAQDQATRCAQDLI